MTSRSSFKIWLCILGVGLFLGCAGWFGLRSIIIDDAMSFAVNRDVVIDADIERFYFNPDNLAIFQVAVYYMDYEHSPLLKQRNRGKKVKFKTVIHWYLKPWRAMNS